MISRWSNVFIRKQCVKEFEKVQTSHIMSQLLSALFIHLQVGSRNRMDRRKWISFSILDKYQRQCIKFIYFIFVDNWIIYYDLFCFKCNRSSNLTYRVFFIESGKVICYKILKISLSCVIFGLRREVTLGHLMSDHFEMHF